MTNRQKKVAEAVRAVRADRAAPPERAPEAVELTILMPCLNEAETLATCIQKAQRFLKGAGMSGEVLVADNGSTDGSRQIANAMGARVVPVASLMEETMKIATAIASMSLPAAMMAKEAVNRAFETTLSEGVRFERRLFHSTFATEDKKEGMAAFVDKRKPQFKGR